MTNPFLIGLISCKGLGYFRNDIVISAKKIINHASRQTLKVTNYFWLMKADDKAKNTLKYYFTNKFELNQCL